MQGDKGRETNVFFVERKRIETAERRFSDVKLSAYAPVTNDCTDEK
jgi:hypothetical protein